MSRFLVTGGTGFLGAALVRRMIAEGHEVRVLDDGSRGARGRLADLSGDFEHISGDVRDLNIVEHAAKGVDTVAHLAAINGTEFFYTKPELVLGVGVQGILNVIAACRKLGVCDLVVASSSEVYQTPLHFPTDETAPLTIPDPLNPRYSYAGSKIISELLAINAGRKDFRRVVIFRPHNVYGPDMAWEHVIPQFCVRALDLIQAYPTGTLPFEIQGDGNQTRAFTHIDDMIDGLMCVIERGQHLNIYNVGNPEELTIAAVAHRIVSCFQRQARLVNTLLPEGSTRRRCPNIDKLRGLGFTPRVSFTKGIGPVVDWYRDNIHLRPQIDSWGI